MKRLQAMVSRRAAAPPMAVVGTRSSRQCMMAFHAVNGPHNAILAAAQPTFSSVVPTDAQPDRPIGYGAFGVVCCRSDPRAPIIDINVNGRKCRALVDTGCSETVVWKGMVSCWERSDASLVAVNDSPVLCCGRAVVSLGVRGATVSVRAVVVPARLLGVDVLLGMTGIDALQGVSVSGGSVRFGSDNPVASVDTAAVVQREAPPEREVCRAVDTAAVVQREAPPEREVCRAVDTAAVVQREVPPEREVCRAVDTATVVQREAPPEREVCRAVDTAAVVQREVPPEREVCRAVDTEPELRIDETDFTAVFDDVWTVRWLRPAAAWMKRTANRLSPDWDTPIVSEELQREVDEVSRRFRACDPARGQWCVTGTSVVVWTDASSIARGVVLTDPDTGAIIEDASWLRAESERDVHINISELDAALNGVNLAVAWGFRRLTLRTDSVTVHRWLSDALSGKARLRTKAQSEMLIRRRVAVFRQLVIEYELEVTIELVASAVNRADEVTRVPNAWLQTADQPTTDSSKAQPVAVAAITSASASDIRTIHENIGHQGVRRTLWYARRELGVRRVSKPAVRDVVRRCQTCASIDPAPERWPGGSLGTERTWDRLAMDVTHVHGHPYLTLVDCGPSRYAIWRRLRRAGALEIVSELENVFLERGAPAEILTDNATEFRGRVMLAFAARWDVSIRFRAAYEPGGNGIVERHHRTIKVMVARQSCSVAEAVHRYNVTPKDGSDPATAPINGVLRHPGRDVDVTPRRTSDEPGDALPLKKPGVYQTRVKRSCLRRCGVVRVFEESRKDMAMVCQRM
ncbi:Gag-Pro-Pol polyprotein [Amphibalanus amphitrite]|uniref:Gag-Pro-Pol polyprotein n=2 Tax=Amphibalanus amphitrite TaxID=1232801 RepID=A0A6A4V2P1_AMPAM|nr:Gag-Pro-Pol polyprotein [Amphibalanus amphitrite]